MPGHDERLLPASEGRAELLGKAVDAQDIATRMRVGYMAQSFSLYEEISLRANLELDGRLFRIPAGELDTRVTAALWEVLVAGPFDYVAVQTRVAPPMPTIPTIQIPAPDLRVYDALLWGATA